MNPCIPAYNAAYSYTNIDYSSKHLVAQPQKQGAASSYINLYLSNTLSTYAFPKGLWKRLFLVPVLPEWSGSLRMHNVILRDIVVPGWQAMV
jgi:hypothetical protein